MIDIEYIRAITPIIFHLVYDIFHIIYFGLFPYLNYLGMVDGLLTLCTI